MFVKEINEYNKAKGYVQFIPQDASRRLGEDLSGPGRCYWNRNDPDVGKEKSQKQREASITDWFRRCDKMYFNRVTGATHTWFQFVLEEYRLSYLHKLAAARIKCNLTCRQGEMDHVAFRPFQESTLDVLYLPAARHSAIALLASLAR